MTDEPFEWVDPDQTKRARRLRLAALVLVPAGLLAYFGLGYAGFYFGSRYKPPIMAVKTAEEPAAPSAAVSATESAKPPTSKVAAAPDTPATTPLPAVTTPAAPPPVETAHPSPPPQTGADSRAGAKPPETPRIINSEAKPAQPAATPQNAPAPSAAAPTDGAKAVPSATAQEGAKTAGKTGEPRQSASRTKRAYRDRGPRLAAPAERWNRNDGATPSANPDAFQQWDEQERRALTRRATEQDLFPFPPHGNSEERSYRSLREGVVRRYLYE